VICGPSGSGKSTLNPLHNRLEEHQAGDIVVDGVTSPTTSRTSRRSAARSAWFQRSTSFRTHHLENLTLAPIWVKKMPKRKPRRSP